MILDEIAAKTKERVAEEKKQIGLRQMANQALGMPVDQEFSFEQALKKPEISFICEVKKASPSKGIIAEHFPYLDIAREYQQAGADALSVLTEPHYFQGSAQYLKEIAGQVTIPVLRKDFIIDEYQIFEAKVLGAAAILCICSLLSQDQLRDYLQLADSLGLSVLTEAHSEREVEQGLKAGARIIGVNNRNLQTFTVDLQNSLRLRKMVPEQVLFVSESGMKSRADIKQLEENGTDAVLIGESLMRTADKGLMLKELRGC